MFVADLTFDCYEDTTLEAAEQAIIRLVNALRFNGQIIGEEFPTVLKDGYFITRVMCPEQDSMHPLNNSPFVKHSLQKLNDVGLLQPKSKKSLVKIFTLMAQIAVKNHQVIFFTPLMCTPVAHFIVVMTFCRCLFITFLRLPMVIIKPCLNGKKIGKHAIKFKLMVQLGVNFPLYMNSLIPKAIYFAAAWIFVNASNTSPKSRCIIICIALVGKIKKKKANAFAQAVVDNGV